MSQRINFTTILRIFLGSVFFSLGFNLFLRPNELNAGGVTGLAMIVVSLLGGGSIGAVIGIFNLPLFAIAGIKIGKRFFLLSLIGMVLSSVMVDVFAFLPALDVEPLLSALYGGALCGVGTGVVYSTGGSTGGSDIIVRLLKRNWQDLPIGVIATCFDLVVAALTGIAFRDVRCTLYSAVAIIISGQIIDAVVYRFDYSRVALIVSKKHERIAAAIASNLRRGATYLQGEGCYSHQETKVVLTAVKRQQLTELKRLVVAIDPDAFIIVQQAHQVLGDGFSRYSKDSL